MRTIGRITSRDTWGIDWCRMNLRFRRVDRALRVKSKMSNRFFDNSLRRFCTTWGEAHNRR